MFTLSSNKDLFPKHSRFLTFVRDLSFSCLFLAKICSISKIVFSKGRACSFSVKAHQVSIDFVIGLPFLKSKFLIIVFNVFSSNLKSSNFTFEVTEDKVKFKVIGYEHGVGLSQTGSNTLAKEGKNYKEIIEHFFKNIQIENIKNN